MAIGGYIKLHRKSLTSEVFADATLWRVWTWCLIRANHKPGRFLGVDIPRGSFATAARTAAKELAMPKTTVHRAFKRLVNMKMIGTQAGRTAEHTFTIVTICNYETYQTDHAASGTREKQQAGRGRDGGGTGAGRIEESQETKESSPPTPPPRSVGADGDRDAWREVEGELFSVGLATAAESAATARDNGCTPFQVRQVVKHFQAKSPAWGVGALYQRLRILRPGQDPDQFWPEPSAAAKQAERKSESDAAAQRAAAERQAAEDRRQRDRDERQRLESRFGATLDGMGREKIKAFIAQVWPQNPQFYVAQMPARGSPTGVLREALLVALSESREATRLTAEAST